MIDGSLGLFPFSLCRVWHETFAAGLQLQGMLTPSIRLGRKNLRMFVFRNIEFQLPLIH